MNKITVVGLGTTNEMQLTLEAAETLLESERLVLRTERHGVADYLRRQGVEFTSLDNLYDGAEDFESLAEAAADQLQVMLLKGPLVYAVPGQGLLEDDTVGQLVSRGLVGKLLPGMTALDSAAAQAAEKLTTLAPGRFRVLPASLVEGAALDAHQPLIITSLDDPITAGEVKLALSAVFGDEAPCVLVSCQKVHELALYQLDWGYELDHNSLLVVLDRDEQAPMDYTDLLAIVHKLRAPDGCPWDREQTHESLRGSMIEECYEAAETIDREDWDGLANELGDVLLQVALHGEIAGEMDEFNHLTVTDEICRKMIYRHPHVFSDGIAETSEQVLENWDKLKKDEKGLQTPVDALRDVAHALPALLRGHKVLSKARKAGMAAPEKLQTILARYEASGAEEKKTLAGQLLLSALAMVKADGAEAEQELQQAINEYIEQCAQ